MMTLHDASLFELVITGITPHLLIRGDAGVLHSDSIVYQGVLLSRSLPSSSGVIYESFSAVI